MKILDEIIGDDANLRSSIQQEIASVHVAMEIYKARKKAKLTQQQLAERVGTKQPVIARLEDADYKGHSLAMLRRIAEALDTKIEVRFVPKKPIIVNRVNR